jgi:hypothetical protein
MKKTTRRNSEWFWAILILLIQVGLSFISNDWFMGMVLVNFIFGVLCIAAAFDGDDVPFFMDFNWIFLICLILMVVCKYLFQFIIEPIMNVFEKFNKYLDNLKIFNKNSETNLKV